MRLFDYKGKDHFTQSSVKSNSFLVCLTDNMCRVLDTKHLSIGTHQVPLLSVSKTDTDIYVHQLGNSFNSSINMWIPVSTMKTQKAELEQGK